MKILNFKNLIEVNDVFNINKRIKNIDKNYKLLYNLKFKRYEIHDKSRKYSFVTSSKEYPSILLLKKLIQMNNKSTSQSIREIEENNEKILLKKQEDLSIKQIDQFNEIAKFSNIKLNQNLSKKLIKKIIQ